MTLQRRLSRRAGRARLAATRALGRLGGNETFATISLPNLVLVGAHHKTGSAWIGSIFREICDRHGLRFFAGRQEDVPPRADVFFQDHSRFDTGSLRRPYRGLHFIRDPRDVVISGSFYHEVSAERWLDRPRRDLEGLSYRQALSRQQSREMKILFEMEHVGSETITDMLNWNRDDPYLCELKYEELIADGTGVISSPILSFLGFPEWSLPHLAEIVRKSHMSDTRVRNMSGGHIRSGIPGEWRTLLSTRLRSRFVEMFGEALVRLGYETDNRWVTSADN